MRACKHMPGGVCRGMRTTGVSVALAVATWLFATVSRSDGESARGGLAGIAEVCGKGNASVPEAVVASLRKAGFTPVVVCRTAKPGDLDAIVSKLDLLILPGGEDVAPARYGEKPSPALGRVNIVRDEFEEQVLRSAVRFEIPVVGICRGEQRLNVFFGGTLIQDLPTELGKAYTVVHRSGERGYRHNVTIIGGSRLAKACGVLNAAVNTSHHQAVKRLAPGMVVTARADDGVVEAIECDWYPAAAVQFHPERLSAEDADPVWERFFANVRSFAGTKPTLPVARRPIGIFASDPGVSVLLARFREMDVFDNATGEQKPDGIPDFAHEEFVYLRDDVNVPNVKCLASGSTDSLRERAVRGVQFLLGSQGHVPAKLIVVSDDRVSAYGASAIQSMPRPHDARVIHAADSVAASVCGALKGETQPYALVVLASGACDALQTAVKARSLAVQPRILVCDRTAADIRKRVHDLVQTYCSQAGNVSIKGMVFDGSKLSKEEVRQAFQAVRSRSGLCPLVSTELRFFDASACVAEACFRALWRDGLLSPARESAGDTRGFFSSGTKGVPQKE
ncbi:MAG: gamma-glutamyl-gamma-aminobutyrate hydrolase family protein [Kiritimatiellae bacterium]|nr:gamma-glutamyl-gamma-aminobutyrate hydrolase family protein [Kiritimatiellia bacterium]